MNWHYEAYFKQLQNSSSKTMKEEKPEQWLLWDKNFISLKRQIYKKTETGGEFKVGSVIPRAMKPNQR